MPRFTVFGSRGYVGSHLVRELKTYPGAEVFEDKTGLPTGGLGHAFYCIGVTTDFQTRLHDTMRAHVSVVMDTLEQWQFESFTYLSSTRVYERSAHGAEDDIASANPASLAEFYKISKLAGEAVCLAHAQHSVRVVRLSNVIGLELPPLTFVPSLISDALLKGSIMLNTALDSAKDYITMEDVVRMLPQIALGGKERVYNVSSGLQITHEQIVKALSKIVGCGFSVREEAPKSIFPDTPASRLREEFGFEPECILDTLPELCRRYEDSLRSK